MLEFVDGGVLVEINLIERNFGIFWFFALSFSTRCGARVEWCNPWCIPGSVITCLGVEVDLSSFRLSVVLVQCIRTWRIDL